MDEWLKVNKWCYAKKRESTLIALPIPQCDLNDFSILYHLTSLDGAKGILTTGIFISHDPDQQASFSVISTKPALARSNEIALRFKWIGAQAMYFGDPFGRGEPQSKGLSQPILYHIFTDTFLKPGEKLRHKNYWQTNLYPGSSGLLFDGIEKINKLPPDIPRKPFRLVFWNYAEKLKTYEKILADHKQIQELKELALTKLNSVFSVP